MGGIPLESCGNANGLTGPNAVEVSPDGTSVYVLSDSSLAVFRRAANGALSQQGCLSAEEAGDACTEVPELVGALALAIAPDGRTLYVASYYPGAILPFRRDPRTGALRELPPLGAGNALEGLADLAVTPDGGHLYAAAPGRDAILAFAVRADGTPAQLIGAAGCVSDVESEDACSHGEVLSRASAVEVSPDARHMYVTSVEPIGLGCACGEELGSVSAFARTPATLTVAKTAAPAGGIRSGKPFRISAQVKTSAKSAAGQVRRRSGRRSPGDRDCALRRRRRLVRRRGAELGGREPPVRHADRHGRRREPARGLHLRDRLIVFGVVLDGLAGARLPPGAVRSSGLPLVRERPKQGLPLLGRRLGVISRSTAGSA